MRTQPHHAAHLGRLLLSLLFPPRCAACDIPLLGALDAALCPTCSLEIGFLGSETCGYCGSTVGRFTDGGKGCRNCSPTHMHFTRAAGVTDFEGSARKLVHALKYRNERHLAPWMAASMVRRILDVKFPVAFTHVMPVPLHPRRYRERGYNQAALLGNHIARALGCPFRGDLLRRIRHTPSQTFLDFKARAGNVTDAFGMREEVPEAQVLLVDDVMTTGATADACARVLRGHGAKRVYVVVFAR